MEDLTAKGWVVDVDEDLDVDAMIGKVVVVDDDEDSRRGKDDSEARRGRLDEGDNFAHLCDILA